MWLTLRIIAWRARRVVAVLVIASFALVTAHVAAPPAPRTRAVVVAARDVPAGAALADADLRVARVAVGLVPASATADVDAVRGRVLAVAVPRGLPVVAEQLTAGRFAVTPPPGSTVLSLEVEPGVLAPGDHVDVVAVGCPAEDGDPGGAREPLAAQEALVVDVGETSVAVALPRDAGRSLAAASAGCTLRPLLRT